MAFQIEDGKGTGIRAAVGTDGRLKVDSVSVAEDHHINQIHNNVWSVPWEGVNPTAADDFVVYLRNDGNAVLNLAGIRLMADTAGTQVKVHVVTGTPAGGSAIVPINRTIGNSNLPTATIEQGADITGLTDGGILYFMQLPVVDTEYKLSISSKIRIPKGKAIALSVENATANITGTFCLVEEDDN